MCDYAGKLVAWLDHELPDEEATNVEWHVSQCAECRKAISAYEEVSLAYLACYEKAMAVRQKRAGWVWAAVVAGIAAAGVMVGALLASPRQTPWPSPPPAGRPPAIAYEKTPASTLAVRARHSPDRRSVVAPVQLRWIVDAPTVEVALPAEALFPPGAVPPGFSFIADVRP